MQIVIEIDEETYEDIKRGKIYSSYRDVPQESVVAIANGTPLPKGHGRLIDADELYSIFNKNCDAYNIDNLSFISDMDMNFDLAPTIIEADKENDTWT